MSQESTEVLSKWKESAAYWSTYSDQLRQVFMPLSLTLIDEAGISSGQKVLDVAGGSGEPSLTIAKFIEPGGAVMCTDAVAEMVETAKQEAARLGISNIEFRQCVAENLPFEDNSFDVAVSRLGAMFFPDALAAFREMLRVIKPAGRLAFAVWHYNDVNPFMSIPTEVISRHVEPDTAEQDSLGAFRFAEAGKLAGILKEAGAIEVQERLFKFDLEAPLTVEEFWTFRSKVSGSVREKLARLSEEEQNEVAAEIRDAVAPFFQGNQMRMPAQMVIVSGTKD